MCAFHQVEYDRARLDLEEAARELLASAPRGARWKFLDRLRGVLSRLDKIRGYGR